MLFTMLALVDCNNFFASCEEVFNPNLSKKALLILSNNDGCVIARSKKAKQLGVKMGDLAYQYKGRKDLMMLSSNFPLYSDMSARVMGTLATCASDLEIYSIDEAFLPLEISPRLILEKVKKWTGIPVSIGIGPTKTLAKLASEKAKKKASSFAYSEELIFRDIPVNEVWGIGSRLAQVLQKGEIYSVQDLISSRDSKIQEAIGIVGLRIAQELRGIPVFSLNEEPEKKKSIVCSRSFGKHVDTIVELDEAISFFAARAAEKLRSQESLSSFLSVFVVNTRFETVSSHTTLPIPTAFTPDLIHAAKLCLSKIYKKGETYRKAGVLLGDFYDIASQPLDLFEKMPSPKKEQAMRLLDAINERFDKTAVQFAAEGIEKKWKSARLNRSPRYTTSWKELLIVS